MTNLTERLPVALPAAPSLADAVHRALQDAIANGRLPKGYRLRERRLAAHFSCSTTPVREAILQLEREGLVRIYPRRGAEVTNFSVSEVAELYELRLVLECHAIRQAILRPLAAQELDNVRAVLRHQRSSVPEGVSPMGSQFHHAVTALGGNAAIADVVARATRQIEAVQSRSRAVVTDGRLDTQQGHEQILATIESGDADVAERTMREHLEWARDVVLASLNEAQAT